MVTAAAEGAVEPDLCAIAVHIERQAALSGGLLQSHLCLQVIDADVIRGLHNVEWRAGTLRCYLSPPSP